MRETELNLVQSVFRVFAVLLVLPATFYFVYWVPFSLLPVGRNRLMVLVFSLACALAVGWYVWHKLGALRLSVVAAMFLGALIIGSAGFLAGFLGPVLVYPEANQGPLLGLLITGPVCFVLGAVVGAIYWIRSR